MNVLLAYFDPGAGSLLLQALVGGFGGFVVVGRYLWSQFLTSNPLQTVMSHSQDGKIPLQLPLR